MSVSFWTMFCVLYGGVLFLSLKRGAFALVLGFLSGLGVAFFCLRYLPGVFTSQAFYAVAAGVLCGVALGTVAEKRRLPGTVFFWLGALLWGCSGGLTSMDVLTALSVSGLRLRFAGRSGRKTVPAACCRRTFGFLAGGVVGFSAYLTRILQEIPGNNCIFWHFCGIVEYGTAKNTIGGRKSLSSSQYTLLGVFYESVIG
nr:hypothetical protein [uncultured Anaerotignum sp.]